MVSQHIINIILQAEDKATQVTQKVEKSIKQIGSTSNSSFNNAKTAADNFKNSVSNANPTIDQMQTKIRNLATSGTSSFHQLSSADQKFISDMNTATPAIQSASSNISQLGMSGMAAFQQLTAAEQQAMVSLSSMGTTANNAGSQIRSGLGNAFNGVKAKISEVASSIREKLSSAVSSVKEKVSSLAQSFQGLGGVISGALGSIGMSSIYDLTIGLAMTREQVTNLTAATMGSRQEADAFMTTMDNMTNSSLVSLNDLAQAMNTIKMSTGMSNAQLEKFSTVVNDIGQRAILMGKDSNEAMTLMQAAGRGLNGEFEILKSNFGITKEQLVSLGWSGAADDVEGYQKALEKALEAGGSMDEMMNTTSGQIALIKKGFTSAGRQIGEVFLPVIKQLLQFGVELKNSHPEVFKYAIALGALASGFAVIAPILVQIGSALSTIGKGIMSIPQKFRDLRDSISSAKDKLVDLKNRLSSSWQEGSLNALKEKFKSLKTTISDIPSKLSNIRERLTTLKTSTIENLKGKFETLKTAISNAGTALSTYGKKAGLATIKLAALVLGVDADIVAKQIQAVTTGEVTVAQGLLNVVMAANPFVLVALAIMGLVAALTYLYFNCEPVKNAFDAIGQKAGELLHWIGGALVGAWNALTEALQPVIEAIGSVLMPILQGLFNLLTGNTEGAMTLFTEAWNNLMNVLGPIGDFIQAVFVPIWTFILQIIGIIITSVMQLVNVFSLFLSGQISLGQALSMIWAIISNTFTTVINAIVGKVIQFGRQLLSYAQTAGRNFLNGVVTFISQLPGKVYTYIVNTASRIAAGALAWVSNAKSKAQSTVNGVMSYIKQLPGKVYSEFINIGSRIMSAGGQLVQKAMQIGRNIVNGLLSAMGIHSPGIIQEKVVAEFVNMIGRVKKQGKSAKNAAVEVGSKIVEGFKNVEIEDTVATLFSKTNEKFGNIEAKATVTQDVTTTTDSDMDTSQMDSEKETMNTHYSDLTTGIMGSFAMMDSNVGLSLANLTAANQNAFTTLSTTEKTNMDSLYRHMFTTLQNIVLQNRVQWSNTTTQTKNQLNTMLKSTQSVTGNMLKAWNTMKSGIVSAASQIKSQATVHFNQLSSTIGGFYRKLQNPSSWGAGGGGMRTSARGVGRSAGGMSNISSILANTIRREHHLPISISTTTAKKTISGNFLDYMDIEGGTINVDDLIRSGYINSENIGLLSKGSAGWTSGVGKNLSTIKSRSNNWSMKGPNIMGRIPTGLSFKVKEFANGRPNISFGSFKSMAESLFSAIPYAFYYDSEKWGTWQNALAHGEANCSDGADALIALAHTCGFSAYKQHGHWNQYGHYFAIVNGQKMDTTGWQQRRTWTPSASAGPTPENPLEKSNMILSDIAQDMKTGESFNIHTGEAINDVELGGEIVIKHEFINLPPNMDEEQVAQMISETTNDESWIKSLVSNMKFQNLDSQIKNKLIRRENRNKGV